MTFSVGSKANVLVTTKGFLKSFKKNVYDVYFTSVVL